jgi:hypothetical protein
MSNDLKSLATVYGPVLGKDCEPWVELPGGAELAAWSADDQVRYNQQNRQRAKLAFYVSAFDFLHDNNIIGDYLEFGCHRARTFRMALTEARRQNMNAMRFYAFDSFAGLPECDPERVWTKTWTTGALKTGEDEFRGIVAEHGLYADKVRTVPGFYDKSLTPELSRELTGAGCRAALVCVDCDLYESAVSVLGFLEPLLQPGTLVYLDDMFAGYKGSPLRGVYKAFREFAAASAWHFEPHMQVGWAGRSFVTCEKVQA